MYKTLFNYFIKGFALAHKSLDIFFIGFVLYLCSTVLAYIQNNAFVDLASILLLFIYMSFSMSVPALLEKRDFFNIVFHNAKRFFLPMLSILFFFIILVIVAFTITFNMFGSNEKNFAAFMQSFFGSFKNWNPYLIVIGSLFAFLNFTPMYFSIENKGVLKSMKESIVFSFKHIRFASLLVIITMLTGVLWFYLPVGTLLKPSNLLSRIFVEYVDFIIFVSSYLFYKSTLKKKA